VPKKQKKSAHGHDPEMVEQAAVTTKHVRDNLAAKKKKFPGK
jgi:hypothetical protein